MQESGARREHPGLKELVVEASRALARLDAGRLEELALSCQALTRDLARANRVERTSFAGQARNPQQTWRCLPECSRRRRPT